MLTISYYMITIYIYLCSPTWGTPFNHRGSFIIHLWSILNHPWALALPCLLLFVTHLCWSVLTPSALFDGWAIKWTSERQRSVGQVLVCSGIDVAYPTCTAADVFDQPADASSRWLCAVEPPLSCWWVDVWRQWNVTTGARLLQQNWYSYLAKRGDFAKQIVDCDSWMHWFWCHLILLVSLPVLHRYAYRILTCV